MFLKSFHVKSNTAIKGSDRIWKSVRNKPCLQTLMNQSTTFKILDMEPKPFESIPGPKPLPFVGNILPYIFGPYSFKKLHLANWDKYEKFGNIVREELMPGVPMVLLFDANDIQTFFRHEGKHPYRPSMEALVKHRSSSYDSVGISHEQGQEWYRLRTVLAQLMLPAKAALPYLEAQNRVADQFVQHLEQIRNEDLEVENVISELYKWALESVSVVLFDSAFGCFSNPPSVEAMLIVQNALQLFEAISNTMYGLPLWRYYPTPTWNKLVDSHDYLLNVADDFVKAAIKRAKHVTSTSTEHRFLSALMNSKQLTEKEVALTAIELLISGIETTSSYMAFTLYNLCKRPDVQIMVHNEIDKVFGKNRDPIVVTELDLHKLPCVTSVFRENGRLNPPTEMIPRIFDHEVIFSGYKVPAGTVTFAVFNISSRLPQFYSEPEKFCPQRWLAMNKKGHPFATLPFGHGPRMCLGRRFAKQEIMLGLVKILSKFRVEYHHEEVGAETGLLIKPDKVIKMKFIKR